MQATMQLNTLKTLPGTPYPLGADFDGSATNFSVDSEVVERVELCLFDEEGRETRINIVERDGYNWHLLLNGVNVKAEGRSLVVLTRPCNQIKRV